MNFFVSTKARLTIWYVGVLAVILIGFSLATFYWFDSVLRSETDKTLGEIAASFENSTNRELQEIAREKGFEPGDPEVKEAIDDSTVEVSFRNYKIFVFSSGRQLVSSTKTSDPHAEVHRETALKWIKTFAETADSTEDRYASEDDEYRVHFHPFVLQGDRFFLIVLHPLAENDELLERLGFVFLVTVPLALVLASFGGFLLMRKSFQPIAEMSEKAEDITANNLHERLPVEHKEDELGRLAATFNRLLGRLELAFDQQQRFMADASHELRTPVAIVRGEAEVSLRKKDRTGSEYRETISIMEREGERMSRIIEDLFTLARADAGEETDSDHLVYVEDILAGTVKSFRSIAGNRNIELTLAELPEMPLEGSEQLLRRLFVNLLDNAVKFARSRVRVSAENRDGDYSIHFEDDGEGIPPESQEQVFQRFYRGDKSRSRQENTIGAGSGAGLGLSISRWIADIHGGKVELASTGDSGTTFTVTLQASTSR